MFLSHIKVKGDDNFVIFHYLFQKGQVTGVGDFTAIDKLYFSVLPERVRESLSCSISAPE